MKAKENLFLILKCLFCFFWSVPFEVNANEVGIELFHGLSLIKITTKHRGVGDIDQINLILCVSLKDSEYLHQCYRIRSPNAGFTGSMMCFLLAEMKMK